MSIDIKELALKMTETETPASYIIFKAPNGEVKAYNAVNKEIDFEDFDAATVLQSVLDAAAEQERSTIYIAEGIYEMSRGVKIRSNVYIKGSLAGEYLFSDSQGISTSGTILHAYGTNRDEKILYVDTANFNYTAISKVRIENILVYGDNNPAGTTWDWRGIGFWCDGYEANKVFGIVELVNFFTTKTAGGILLRNVTQTRLDKVILHDVNPGIDVSQLPTLPESYYTIAYLRDLIEDNYIGQLQVGGLYTNNTNNVGIRILGISRSVIHRISAYNIPKGVGIYPDVIRTTNIGILEANDYSTQATVGKSILASFYYGTSVDQILIYNQDTDSSYIHTDGSIVPVRLIYVEDKLGNRHGLTIDKYVKVGTLITKGVPNVGSPWVTSWQTPDVIQDLTTGTVSGLKNSGTVTFSGDNTTKQFKIAHGLISKPSKILVTPASADASGSFYVTADSTYIYVNYSSPPPSGNNNVTLYWFAEL
ncbi:MAG: hypothetical protein JHC26_10685 [Thermofilum sp.]|jgi:hypothetical protein|uniref:hypothetical protein n=1 Tax=Thermofilum sp. TaxID=1961369 RepID=UPI00258A2558|nr:hypothetical protein [Thermofilum sp.]MCI4409547.1 hypothetical protein [Thermofilum sp.]